LIGATRFVWVIFIILIVGCSNSTGNSPTIPQLDITNDRQIENFQSNRHLWGFWTVNVDPAEGTISVIPERTVAYHHMRLNMVRMMEETVCQDCIQISNLNAIPPDQLSLDLTLKHPIEDNLNLTGFDVRAIFISQGETWFDEFDRNVSLDGTYPVLTNPDGYTAVFNPVEFPEDSVLPATRKYITGKYALGENLTSTLNPFVAYGTLNPRRMFLPGAEETLEIILQVPGGTFSFGYAVDASWIPPGVTVTDPETDFPPEANCPEAFSMSAALTELIFDTENCPANFQVALHDHQGLDTVDGVYIECPGVFDGEIELEYFSTLPSGAFLFQVDLINSLTAPIGLYNALVRVSDINSDPNIGDVHGWTITAFEVLPHEQLNDPPTAIAEYFPLTVIKCEDITFSADGSTDPNDDIVLYEWDWENDGTYDDTGIEIIHSFLDRGHNYVQLRVTDEFDNWDELDEPLDIWVTHELPTAVAEIPEPTYPGVPLQLVGSGSHDNDCGDESIINYHWWFVDESDWPASYYIPCQYSLEWDGIVSTGEFGSLVVGGIGNGWVQLEVEDDEGGEAKLDTTIPVSIINNPDKNGWVRTWGTHCATPTSIIVNGVDTDVGVVTDADNNIYMTVSYLVTNSNQEYDFDPGPLYDIHYGNSDTDPSIALIKFDSIGTFVWAKTIRGAYEDRVHDLNIDSSRNLYLTGRFSGIADFDPGDGVEERTAAGEYTDIYVLKLDPDGQFLWVNTIGAEKIELGYASTCDSSGNVFATGMFYETVDFDPGTGVDEHTSHIFPDTYLTKYDSDGNYLWTRTWGGDGNTAPTSWGEMGYDVKTDSSDNIYVTGYFGETVDFDPGPAEDLHTATGSKSDAFLVKYNPSGDFQWAKTWGGEDQWSFGDRGDSIFIDDSDIIYVAGIITGECDLDPGPDEDIRPTQDSDCCLTSFDTSGNYIDAWTWGGLRDDFARDVTIDSSGNFWITGAFSQTADFDPSGGVHEKTAVGTPDAFLLKLDSSGQFVWVGTWGGEDFSAADNNGSNLAHDSLGNIFVTGFFVGTCDFDPGPDEDLRTAKDESNQSGGFYLSKFPPGGDW